MTTRNALARAAERQGGLVTAAQAPRVGVGARELAEAVADGLLSELGWSVYQMSGAGLAPRYAYPLAAWLALKPAAFGWERPPAEQDAALSHESACRLWGLGSLAAPRMIFTADSGSGPAGIEVRPGRPPVVATDVANHHGVPVTTPQRTIRDLVTSWTDHDDVRRALSDAVRLDLVDLGAVHRDLLPLAGEYDLPTDGPEFAGRLLAELDLGALSGRNRAAFDELVRD